MDEDIEQLAKVEESSESSEDESKEEAESVASPDQVVSASQPSVIDREESELPASEAQ